MGEGTSQNGFPILTPKYDWTGRGHGLGLVLNREIPRKRPNFYLVTVTRLIKFRYS